MRKLTASVMLLMAACATAQTNAPIDNFTLVTNLWWNGYKTNVLQIAEQRLAANSNDLAGLILKMEYNIATNNVECFSNDIFSVMSAMADIESPHFVERKDMFIADMLFSLSFLSTDFSPSQEEILADKAKFNIIHKPLIYVEELKALHDDGLF